MRLTYALFVLYIALWSVQGILVHGLGTRDQGSLIVLCQEVLKLVISLYFWKSDNRWTELWNNGYLGLKFFVPAGLYAIYNNLTLIGLSIFDPASYFVLMQLRVVVTGLIHSSVFGRQITFNQWIGLFLVMLGGMFKEVSGLEQLVVSGSTRPVLGYLIVGSQILLSTSAGVVTEKYLKTSFVSVSLGNVYMYSISIMMNLVWVLAVWARGGLDTGEMFPAGSFFVILNGALMGIVTSLFLKHLNSVWKSIASAIELWTTALLAWLVFGYPIEGGSVLGFSVLSLGVVIYATSSR